ncbi:hypothetical protein GBA52_024699 [Prunus armeniaca]|nr:hypothetical protein GBA52_024699 [Prunus armeniaca]
MSIVVNGKIFPIDPVAFTSHDRGTIIDLGTTFVEEVHVPFVRAVPTIAWCISFQKAQGGVTILGDLVLKDKIIVYDLFRQRIGWANYDVLLSIYVIF